MESRNACEVVRLGDRAATYGVGPRKMLDGYAYILPYKGWVNLGFYQGVDLADPKELLEGTGARMRHVKIRSIDDAKRPEVRALIKAALARREEPPSGRQTRDLPKKCSRASPRARRTAEAALPTAHRR